MCWVCIVVVDNVKSALPTHFTADANAKLRIESSPQIVLTYTDKDGCQPAMVNNIFAKNKKFCKVLLNRHYQTCH